MINFGEEFNEIWTTNNVLPKYTEFGKDLLKKCTTIEMRPIQPLTIDQLLANSEEFPIKFPIDTCRIKSQKKKRYEIIEKQAASAYPIIHERALWLYTRFLEHKLKYGTEVEKKLYDGMSIMELIDRLLMKRCVKFCGAADYYKLLCGQSGGGCYDKDCSNDSAAHSLHINNLISYHEVKLSAFLSISSHTEFINDGSRRNAGKMLKSKRGIEREGVVCGLIGPRLHRSGEMEHQDCIITKEQNTIENGYGERRQTCNDNDRTPETYENPLFDYRQMYNEFYDSESILYENCTIDDQRFGNCFDSNAILDNVMLKKRYTISFDTFLLESEARAAECGKRAYLHVVGIGLGVWAFANHQNELFLQTFEERIKCLMPKLKNIGWIHFSYFNSAGCGDLKNNTIIRRRNVDGDDDDDDQNGITIFLSNRNPADKLSKFKNALLIASFAWDANAFPGNEFWSGSLCSSSDPAAACSTLITELYNPYINKTMISGNNLHIASVQFGGVYHLSDYVNKIL